MREYGVHALLLTDYAVVEMYFVIDFDSQFIMDVYPHT